MTVGIAQLAAAYAAGVFLALKLNTSSVLMFMAVYCLVTLVMFLFGRKTEPMRLVAIAVFCAAVTLTHYYSSPMMQNLSAYVNSYVTVEGQICETPEKYDSNYRYIIDTTAISIDGTKTNLSEKLMITSPDEYKFGDTASFTGFVKEIPERLNESGFDLKRYYKSKGCFFRLYSDITAPAGNPLLRFSPAYLSARIKNSVSLLIDKYARGDKGAILKAVIIGNKKDFSDEFNAVLTRTGTTRFFYPAFMRVMLLVSIMGMFSTVIKKKPRDILTVILLAIMALFESSHPAMLRAFLTALGLIVFRRRLGFVYYADVVGAAVLVIGIANPLMFFNAGFVMSVTACILVSCFYKPLSKKIKINNKFVQRAVLVGIICTIGILPLSAYYFHGVSPYTIVTALVFLPATAVILILSPLLLLMLALFGIAPVAGEIVTAMIWIYMRIPNIIDALPFSHIALAAPKLITITAFYIMVLSLHLYNRKKNYAAFISFMVSAGFFAVALTGAAGRINTAEFNFVNVGQGDGAVIQVPYRNTVLIDGGGGNEYNSDYDPGERIYVPYLESKGITKADCAIVSHCHSDHADGIIAAIKSLNVRHVYVPETSYDNEVYRRLETAAAQYGTTLHVVTEITRLTFNSGLVITLFPPPESPLLSDDENDKSLLVRTTYGNTDCLFTGDMPKIEELLFLSERHVEQAEILKVAHHGSDTSSSQSFLEAVSPEYAVISVGKDNSYSLPSKEVLKRLQASKILRTDINGDITITADKDKITDIRTFR